MKKLLFIITLFFSIMGCLFPYAPHIYNYTPVKYEKKEKYSKTNSNVPYPYLPYYYSKMIDNHTKIISSFDIISLNKLKTIRLKMRIDRKNRQLQFDSIIIQISKMQFRMNSTTLYNDSVFNMEYSKQIKISDKVWNKQIGNFEDSISVKVYIKREIYNEKYYFDGK